MGLSVLVFGSAACTSTYMGFSHGFNMFRFPRVVVIRRGIYIGDLVEEGVKGV